jgi:hypothetical protein
MFIRIRIRTHALLIKTCKKAEKTIDGHVCLNSDKRLSFIVCRPRETNFRFSVSVCSKQAEIWRFRFSVCSKQTEISVFRLLRFSCVCVYLCLYINLFLFSYLCTFIPFTFCSSCKQKFVVFLFVDKETNGKLFVCKRTKRICPSEKDYCT